MASYVGIKHGILTCVKLHEKRERGSFWIFQCECGGTKVYQNYEARKIGHCGCLTRAKHMATGKANSIRSTRHGMSKTKLYKVYHAMIDRCRNPNHKHYASYGGRGISVCERWKESFENFYEDMGEPNGLTLERVDNNDGYSAENCVWATRKQQSRNTRMTLRTINGETKSITEWADQYGIKKRTVQARLYRGWSFEDAISKPTKKKVTL